MATKKKMLQAAAGNAGGAGGVLNVEDVFSTYLYEGNGSSQVIENGINLGQSFGSGSARFGGESTGEYLQTPVSTDFQLGNNDFTLEFFMRVTNDAGENKEVFSVGDSTGAYDFLVFLSGGTAQVYMSSNGTSWDLINGGNCGNYTIGKWHHIAVTRNVDGVRCYLDGVQGSGHGIGSANVYQSANQISIGRGQTDKRFNGYLSDFHFVNGTAKYISDFTVPTSALSVDANTKLLTLQQDNLLTDNSTTGHTITEYGGSIYDEPVIGPFDAAEAGEGGLVWFKFRESSLFSSADHWLVDTERSGAKYLRGNTTAAEAGSNIATFNSNGFSINVADGEVNYGGGNSKYASWTFRKAPKFFDVVTYTGNGVAGRTISHNLGTTVGMLVVKSTSHATDWKVLHRSVGATIAMELNNTRAATDVDDAFWDDTPPTDTHFTVGSNSGVNLSGRTYVAYLFAHNDGDGEFGPDGDADIIKCGSFTGVGSGAVDVDLGFEPQLVLTKNTSRSADWMIQDVMRGMGLNSWNPVIANKSEAELSTTINRVVPSATGFTINNDGGNDMGQSGDTVIYIAIRRGTKVPESADEVFAVETSTAGSGTLPLDIIPTIGFAPDAGFVIRRLLNGSPVSTLPYLGTRLLGYGTSLLTDRSSAEGGATLYAWDTSDAPLVGDAGGANDSGASNIHWLWKRAPGFFDAVAYTGTGSVMTVSHNLGVAPEMMWVKCRSNTKDWAVYHSDVGSTNELRLNSTSASFGTTAWNNTAPTDSVFTLGVLGRVNSAVSEDYIAYLFASVDGISKVGSFSHATGTPTNVDCGFTNGARFVLWKKYSNTDGWQVYDTTRGIVTGDDPFLQLNSDAAEITSEDLIDPLSSGFTVSANKNSGDYIFYAIA